MTGKLLSRPFPLVVRRVLLSILLFLVVLTLIKGSLLVDANAGPRQVDKSVPATNLKFGYMHSRAEWEMVKERSYPSQTLLDGPILSQRQSEAVAQLQKLEREAPQRQPSLGWTNIGPAHITSTACGWGNENSGRVVALAIDPSNSSHWLIGAADGGIWQTTDGGGTWSPRTDDQASLNGGAIAFAPGNPNIVYASAPMTGLLKSTDGGTTWNVTETNVFGGRAARAFAISPTIPDVAVAALQSSFFADDSYGIYRTTDGGVTWTQKLSQSASALVSVPGDFSRQYAAIGQEGGSAANGLYRSTDSGQSWQPIAGPWGPNVGQISLALAPSNPDVLYVWAQIGSSAPIWKSTNAWSSNPPPSWSQLPFPDQNQPSKFGGVLSVDPHFPDDVYAAANYIWKYHNPTGWKNILGCPQRSRPMRSQTQRRSHNATHVDFFELVWLGSDFLVANDGGVFRRTASGSWEGLNADLRITQFYWGALHPTNPNFAIVGAQDNGTPIYTGSSIWQHFYFTGDGMSAAISVADPDNDWLISKYFGRIFRTRNRGLSWDRPDSAMDHTCAPFFFRFTSCPVADVVLAGTTKLWRSDNVFTAARPTWSINSPDLGGCPNDPCCNTIRAIEFAPSDTSCSTYAIAGGAKILATTSAGAPPWLTLTSPGELPNATATDLAFDPQNAQRLYATFSGYNAEPGRGSGHLFVCDDVTAQPPTWTDISPHDFAGHPIDTPHSAIAIDPNHTSDLYVGTDVGVIISTDGGMSWNSVASDLLPKVRIWDIQINRSTNKIVVFTYGRGAYSGMLPMSGSPIGSIEWHRKRFVTTRNTGNGRK
ncbi:MAG TPA: hypothetical protein VH254_06035 [Candidatus Udaeobacter sp.]|nr:hypothetical protein [Candidatus Udaeobacter sp.]